MDTDSLLWGVLFGSIGLGFFVFAWFQTGKKTEDAGATT